MNEMMYVSVRIGDGIICMCDLVYVSVTHPHFGQFWGDQMHRRKKPRDWTGCLADLSHLLSSFCMGPMD